MQDPNTATHTITAYEQREAKVFPLIHLLLRETEALVKVRHEDLFILIDNRRTAIAALLAILCE